MVSEPEVCLDPLLESRNAKLLQTSDLALRERLVREVGERRTPPEGECSAQCVRVALFDESFETLEVQLARLDTNQVARRSRDDPVGADRLTQLRDEVLQRVQRRSWRVSAPKLGDQPVDKIGRASG